jgi:GNAT superfamily N-acetyltransferase
MGGVGKNGAVLIRSRRDDDLRSCGDVLRQVHGLDGYPRYLPGDLMEFLDPPEAYGVWVAEADGTVVGHVALVPRSSQAVMDIATAALGLPESSLGVVARLFVAPQARRSGTGAALLAAAVAEARARGLSPVLDVVSDAHAAIALYQRLGWTRAGQTTVRFSNGRSLDEYVFVGPPSS